MKVKEIAMYLPLVAYLILVLPQFGMTLLNFDLMGFGFGFLVGLIGLVLAVMNMKK